MGRAPTFAQQAIIRACDSALPSADLFGVVATATAAVIPHDAACWTTTDPETLMPTTSFGVGLGDAAAPDYFESEYLREDVATWPQVARSSPPVAILSTACEGQLDRSDRYRTIMAPRGFEHEMRTAFLDGAICWGAVSLLRRRGEPDFSQSDADFMISLAPKLGRALRSGLLVQAASASLGDTTPGVVMLRENGEFESATGSAERWIEELGGSVHGNVVMPISVRAVAARFLASRAHRSGVLPELQVRAASGRWLSLHAAALGGHVAIIIQPARPLEIVPVILESRGLSQREREVALLALQGLANKMIARELGISSYTAGDHLKSIFQKLEVPGRKEFAASVLFGYVPDDTNPRTG